jgi:ABC-type Zn uptake system ZnuABC Zn-binding protein ZnuA
VLDFGDEHAEESAEEQAGEEQHEHAVGDPHTWMNPNNVILWVQNIAAALAQADPANATAYQENAAAYTAELQALDEWICQQVAQISPERRKLVTDHASLGYFADEYGFEQVGLVIPSLSTSAAPSAQELAALQDAIRQENVRAILVGMTVNPTLAAQVAADTGVQLIFVYTGSLSAAGEEADNYLAFMRYNVTAIVNALK